MNYPSEPTLDLFRGPGLCALCGKWFASRDAHHAYLKQGGGGAIDVPENLADLCRWCHTRAEAYSDVAEAVRVRVWLREFPPTSPLRMPDGRRVGIADVWIWLWLVRRTPKEGPLPPRPWETVDAAQRTTAADARHKPSALGDQGRDPTGHSDALPSNAASRPAPRLRKAARDPVDEVETGWVEF